MESGLEIMQPATLKRASTHEALSLIEADIFVVVAFGLILPPEVLRIPRLGCVNVHFSLLPALRGAAPVQWALINGLERTGISVIQMDEGMDTGPILGVSEEPISESDTAGSVESRLSTRGAELLMSVLGEIERGEAEPVAQDRHRATYAPKITPQDARIDWGKSAIDVHNLIRAMNPRPGAWGVFRQRRLKIWAVVRGSGSPDEDPGTLQVHGEVPAVRAADGFLVLDQVQPEGKRRMTGTEFVRGYRPVRGERID